MQRKILGNRNDAATLALQALVWVLADDDRAQRLLSLTGLDVDELRATAGSEQTQLAILDYLMAYEPDLIACAETISLPPEKLVQAHALLSGGHDWG